MNRQTLTRAGKTMARILTGVLVCSMLAGASAGFISPDLWVVPSILCLVFLPLWAGVLVAGVLWVCCSRRKVDAIICGAALLITLPVFFQVCPLRFPSGPGHGELPLSVLTYNVVECNDMEWADAPYSRSINYVIHSGADIVCLQEMHGLRPSGTYNRFTRAQMDSLASIYPYQIKIEHEEQLLLSKYPATYVTGRSRTDNSPYNYQLYRVDIHGHTLSVLNVHLPSYRLTNDQRTLAHTLKHNPGKALDREHSGSLYRKLSKAFVQRAAAARHLRDMADTIPGPLIICGDFNDVPGSYAYRTLRSAGLADAYCDAGLGPMVTYNAYHFLFHIDQVLYREGCGMRAYEASRGELRSSDHYPVTARFALNLAEM